jgi:hypothetical protein
MVHPLIETMENSLDDPVLNAMELIASEVVRVRVTV